MESGSIKRLLEGFLFLSGQPVSLKRLKEALTEADHPTLRQLIDQLNAEYVHTERAFRIQEVAGGYQLVTDPQLAPWLKRALQMPKEELLSKPALETLAIVAYRQPITKADIEIIRGVDGSATLETLLERQLIRIVGRKETPGRPLLYGTTPEFLRHFGLKGLDDLPPMKEPFKPMLSFGTPEPGASEASPAAPPMAESVEGRSAG